ncbi:cupin domain-containing protein [Pseudomonas chlororaphis]|uniref:cupin domain-containing protein n=1 Tax=Pseudomonas chlororaphis TaxID=587753 RepID=UPI001CB9BE94|nr:cupin domain-containing protein [Pseudomonas chlororaphis]
MNNHIDFKISKEEFISNFADREMYIVRGAVSPSLLNWTDLDSALYYIDPVAPHVRVHKNGLVSEACYVEDCSVGGVPRKRLNTSAVQDLLSDGATVVLNRIDARLERIRHLCAEVAKFTNAETLANGYLAFSGRGSFGPHWDTHDVMAIQLIGRKRWKVYKPTFHFPISGQTSKEHKADCPNEPVFDGVLEAGDLLYLPRGWWHDAVPIGETFHVAIGMYTATVLHYVAWLCQNSLLKHEELRQSLRPECDLEQAIVAAGKVLEKQLNDPKQLALFMEELKRASVKPHQPFSLESLVTSVCTPELEPIVPQEAS